MNRIINKGHLLFLMGILLAIASCKKDKIVFQGNDNFITSFALNQSGNVFYASITDDQISVTAPDELSLNNAKVIFVLGENAKIYPDPASVTDWNDDMQFVITAHNGDQKTYRYTVVRSDNSANQSVILPTQADVDAFGKLNITEITGSLIIGSTSGNDSITTLAPLIKLKKIGYAFTVYPTYSAEEFVGLDNLTSVGDIIRIEGVKNLARITLPKLATAGIISIKSPVALVVDMPSLKSVFRALLVDGPIAGVGFPALQKVGGMLTFSSASNTASVMSKITLPSLSETGGLTVSYLPKIQKVELPDLVKINGDMNFVVLPALTSISSPKLATVAGVMTMPANSALREVSFPSITQAGTIIIDIKAVNAIEFPKLAKVTGNIRLNGPAVDGIKNFNALTEVGGELYLAELAAMRTFGLPATLKKIGKLSVVYRTATPPSQINVKGLQLGELNFRITAAVKIIGEDDFKGTLNIYPEANNAVFPELEGFSSVDSLYFFPNYYTEVVLKGIKKIRKGFTVPGFGQSKLDLGDLEEIGGAMTFQSITGIANGTLEISKLKKINGGLRILVNSPTLNLIKFTSLESVGGDFFMGAGAALRGVSDMQFPKLERVGGQLTIAPASSSTTLNAKVTHLNGFSALKEVQGIEVRNFSALNNFEGLKNAFQSVSSAKWSTSKNAYNPTYADLAAGRWIK